MSDNEDNMSIHSGTSIPSIGEDALDPLVKHLSSSVRYAAKPSTGPVIAWTTFVPGVQVVASRGTTFRSGSPTKETQPHPLKWYVVSVWQDANDQGAYRSWPEVAAKVVGVSGAV
jgi:hypothetical protein